ncbi:hypothetical protein J6590_006923 [Homalodisca vitripennis]|nr:hypothetical protein J6590_006923 [Homalodisca vitripennis]
MLNNGLKIQQDQELQRVVFFRDKSEKAAVSSKSGCGLSHPRVCYVFSSNYRRRRAPQLSIVAQSPHRVTASPLGSNDSAFKCSCRRPATNSPLNVQFQLFTTFCLLCAQKNTEVGHLLKKKFLCSFQDNVLLL